LGFRRLLCLWAYSYWAAPLLPAGARRGLGSRACASWLGSARDFFELAKLARLGSPVAREPAQSCPSRNELDLARRARVFFSSPTPSLTHNQQLEGHHQAQQQRDTHEESEGHTVNSIVPESRHLLKQYRASIRIFSCLMYSLLFCLYSFSL
jgi:hypothetical protein